MFDNSMSLTHSHKYRGEPIGGVMSSGRQGSGRLDNLRARTYTYIEFSFNIVMCTLILL